MMKGNDGLWRLASCGGNALCKAIISLGILKVGFQYLGAEGIYEIGTIQTLCLLAASLTGLNAPSLLLAKSGKSLDNAREVNKQEDACYLAIATNSMLVGVIWIHTSDWVFRLTGIAAVDTGIYVAKWILPFSSACLACLQVKQIAQQVRGEYRTATYSVFAYTLSSIVLFTVLVRLGKEAAIIGVASLPITGALCYWGRSMREMLGTLRVSYIWKMAKSREMADFYRYGAGTSYIAILLPLATIYCRSIVNYVAGGEVAGEWESLTRVAFGAESLVFIGLFYFRGPTFAAIKGMEELREAVIKHLRLTILLSIAMIIFWLRGDTKLLLEYFIGETGSNEIMVFGLLACVVMTRLSMWPIATMAMLKGNVRLIAVSELIPFICFMALSPWLIQSWGMAGAAWAYMASAVLMLLCGTYSTLKLVES